MIPQRARVVALWAASLAAAIYVVAQARYITDLSAFLPAHPNPVQQLLVDQLRDGPASRLVLVALEGGGTDLRAATSARMTRLLRRSGEFSNVDDGDADTRERDRRFLFEHRYLLSDAVTPQRFSVPGLRAAIVDTIAGLSSSGGLLLKSLLPHDPTGEMLHVLDTLAHAPGPRTEGGVWISADGARTLLLAQTAAAGSDTDGQERALAAVRGAFATALREAAAADPGGAAPRASGVRLAYSGPGVFAVAARAKIKRAATRLSLISSVLVVAVLLTVYRSTTALGLGLLPVASGALVGIAAVALGFGAVHGITLGFGITLIGESVDYSIYFFIQSSRNPSHDPAQTWRRTLWPTIRLGMLTSVCGFASLLPSGFPGLAQLGLYSISGLVCAALVTRFVLPALLPAGLEIRDVSGLGLRLARLRAAARGGGRTGLIACAIAATALLVLLGRHHPLWNRELASLSPVSAEELAYDATLRADLGAADVLDVVVVSGRTLEAVLRGAERAATVLTSLVDANVIGDFDSPADYLPSAATQRARRDALPDGAQLRANLAQATAGLALRDERLQPFIDDVGAARRGALIDVADLAGTSLAAGLNALLLHHAGGWSALLPLHAPRGPGAPQIDVPRAESALTAARLEDTRLLDLKTQSDALYAGYLREALRLSSAGLVVIVLLLAFTLRSVGRVLRVLAPLLLAVLVVAAGLTGAGQQLTILHLVGMLLIVAVGSNYALFFDREAGHEGPTAALTLASLAIANLSTVIGFGLLAFSQVPVLVALGTTVAPGTFLALVFAALMTAPGPRGTANA